MGCQRWQLSLDTLRETRCNSSLDQLLSIRDRTSNSMPSPSSELERFGTPSPGGSPVLRCPWWSHIVVSMFHEFWIIVLGMLVSALWHWASHWTSMTLCSFNAYEGNDHSHVWTCHKEVMRTSKDNKREEFWKIECIYVISLSGSSSTNKLISVNPYWTSTMY